MVWAPHFTANPVRAPGQPEYAQFLFPLFRVSDMSFGVVLGNGGDGRKNGQAGWGVGRVEFGVGGSIAADERASMIKVAGGGVWEHLLAIYYTEG